jgi:AraC-like DNA-binding protein
MNQPAFRLIRQPGNKSFVFKLGTLGLNTRWHYHPELELILFIKGNTSAIIGNAFKEFEEGDVVLLGANFPHVLQESKSFKKANPDFAPSGLIIQFTEDFLGTTFFNKPELLSIKELFQKANKGIRMRATSTKEIRKKLLEMANYSDSRKLLALLDILLMMSEIKEIEPLIPVDYHLIYQEDEERMNKIHQYVYKNFQQKISNRDVASIANMTEASFCRYFKSRTLKTFTFFLNEVRVAYACKMLLEKDNSVTDVCFASGYSSLPYFSKKFKDILGVSPQQYQQNRR